MGFDLKLLGLRIWMLIVIYGSVLESTGTTNLDYNYRILMDLDLEILGLWFRIIKMGQLWTKRDFVARKTYLKFLWPNSNNLWHAQIKQIFLSIPRHFGRNELSIKASSLSIKDMFINMWQFLAILWTFELLHFDQLFSSNLQSGD